MQLLGALGPPDEPIGVWALWRVSLVRLPLQAGGALPGARTFEKICKEFRARSQSITTEPLPGGGLEKRTEDRRS